MLTARKLVCRRKFFVRRLHVPVDARPLKRRRDLQKRVRYGTLGP